MKFTIITSVLGTAMAQKPNEDPFTLSGAYTGRFGSSESVTYDFPLVRSCTSGKEDCGTVTYPHLSVKDNIIMFQNAKCADRSWWAGEDALDKCTYFVEEFYDTISLPSSAPDGSYASVGMAPQRDGSILWTYFNGMDAIESAFLYPSGMAPIPEKDMALRDHLAAEQERLEALPGWNAELNGVWEGQTQNPIGGAPYPVMVSLNVTAGCGNHCGFVTYPTQGLVSPMANLRNVDTARLPELKGPNGTGRCWQLNENYTDEDVCFGTDAGWSTSPVAFCEQIDGTLQWNMLWGKPEIALVMNMIKTDVPVPVVCPAGTYAKCLFTDCSAELCRERC